MKLNLPISSQIDDFGVDPAVFCEEEIAPLLIFVTVIVA